MFSFKFVFALVTCSIITNYNFVAAQDGDDGGQDVSEEPTEPPPIDYHTFVALVDLVFTDGNKRVCTGTIIHDNVVITAAHCFNHSPDAEPELTASFVVIGTKKMYDTGYENYLPIERVIKHPKFKGWTADLALVYTFVGMTSDKPGNVVPLGVLASLTPVDSNVTILSWGHCKDDLKDKNSPEHPKTRGPPALRIIKKKRICTSSEDNHDSCEPNPTTYASIKPISEADEEPSSEADTLPQQDAPQRSHLGQARVMRRESTPHRSYERVSKLAKVNRNSYIDSQQSKEVNATRPYSRYLSSGEANEHRNERKPQTRKPIKSHNNYYSQRQRYNRAREDTPLSESRYLKGKESSIWIPIRPRNRRTYSLTEELIFGNGNEQTKKSMHTYNSTWRRSGPKEHRLSIETFGFVNVQMCKKLVDRTLPQIYAINTNEVVCFAADEHYISEDDTGAPVIRQGYLVAVTLGGVQCDGDHAAIGIKMNCFCNWITENLPSGGEDIKCCKDCCGEVKKAGGESKYYIRQKHTNQYLRKQDENVE